MESLSNSLQQAFEGIVIEPPQYAGVDKVAEFYG